MTSLSDDTAITAPRRVVVVGASLAGLRAAESLRRAGYEGELVLVGEEPHLPYNRPPLSKDIAADRAMPESLALGRLGDDVKWRLGTQVVQANLSHRAVELGTGEQIAWSGLVIATGLRPRALRLPGPEAGRHRLRTFYDSVAIAQALRGARRVVVVGAGFIGCEMVAAAASMGVAVDLIAPEPTPLAHALGDQVGTEVKRRLIEMGVRFHPNTSPIAYLGSQQVSGVMLANESVLHADVVVEAVGSEPNVAWLVGNDLDLTDGVLTDSCLRVDGRDDVVACGDVARFPILARDETARRLEHWAVAVDTGRLAGSNLARHLLASGERPDEFDAIPSFWSHLGVHKIQSFGLPGIGLHDVRLLEGDLTGDAVMGYYRADELVASSFWVPPRAMRTSDSSSLALALSSLAAEQHPPSHTNSPKEDHDVQRPRHRR